MQRFEDVATVGSLCLLRLALTQGKAQGIAIHQKAYFSLPFPDAIGILWATGIFRYFQPFNGQVGRVVRQFLAGLHGEGFSYRKIISTIAGFSEKE